MLDAPTALGLYIAVVGLLLAVFVLGPLPACAGSPLALLYRFFTRDLCDLARAAARRAGGERGEAALLSGAAAARRWAPLGVQLVYLALVAIGYHVFVDRVLDDLRDQLAVHRVGGPLAVTLAVLSYAAASFAPAGAVTARNVGAYLAAYPCDGALFAEGELCRQLGIARPARAKYVRSRGELVPRFDHVCPWVNGPVGERNLRWFLAFLAAHAALCAYGAAVMLLKLAHEVDSRQVLLTTYARPDGGVVHPSAGLALRWAIAFFPGTMFLFLLLAVVALMLLAFTGYHLYLAATNQTTYESAKRAAMLADLVDDALDEEEERQRQQGTGQASGVRGWLAGVRHRRLATARVRRELEAAGGGRAALTRNAYDRGCVANLLDALCPERVHARAARARKDQ